MPVPDLTAPLLSHAARTEFYRRETLRMAERLLSLLDRNPSSPTYGCFDRNFWQYRTLVDAPSAAFQQAVDGLSILWSRPFDGNPYFNQPVLAEWITAGLRYWRAIQNADGSLNEWYRNERSYCATAFTTFGVARAVSHLGPVLPETERTAVGQSLVRACAWLDTHPSDHAANQLAAGFVAMQSVARLGILPDSASVERQTLRLLGRQTEEGWFREYDGADIGYSHVLLDLLGHALDGGGDERLIRAGNKLTSFLVEFIHPDGSTGGEYGSRNGRYHLPFGLEAACNRGWTGASTLLAGLHGGLLRGKGVGPGAMDDRYIAYFLFSSYALACFTATHDRPTPHGECPRRWWPGAGLLVDRTGTLHTVVGLSKGGVLRIFRRSDGAPLYGDNGLQLLLRDGRRGETQWHQSGSTGIVVREHDEDVEIVLQRAVALAPDVGFNARHPILFAVLRVFGLQYGPVAAWLGRFLKRWFIQRHRFLPLQYQRRIILTPSRVEICEALSGPALRDIARITGSPFAASLHSPASRLFAPGDLAWARTDGAGNRSQGRQERDRWSWSLVVTEEGTAERRTTTDGEEHGGNR